ncbi:unnamed protein product, partial [Mesorhabditis spiculigera]
MSAVRAQKSGLALEAQQKIHGKYDEALAHEILEWVREVTGEDIDTAGRAENLCALFKDGHLLCKLANALESGAIKKVNTSAMAFKQMENISFFLAFAEKHVHKTELFQTVDLYEGQDPNAIVTCLSSLARKGDKFGKASLGPKEAEGEKREWSNEQIRAGQGVIGLQMGSNKGATASGINFGQTRHIGGVVGPRGGDMFFHATLARSFINALSLRGDDDFVDRLNYYYTPIMLSIACLVISAKQYGGTPIECWVNPHSRESMEEYIESYCWIQNTYWVPMYENIPDDHTAREERQIGYYQWVPFILIAEALMFSLPCIFWRLLSWQSGLNIQHLINAACDIQAIVDHSQREKAIESLSASFIDTIDLQGSGRDVVPRSLLGRMKCNRLFSGHYVSVLYVVTKALYALNIALQFAILNACLKNDQFVLFGFQVLNDLIAGKPWTETGHFPRVTLCDFEVRYLANLNRYTVQCALLINIINEKSADKRKEMKFVEPNKVQPADRIFSVIPFAPQLLDRFVGEFLRADGVFILRMMANHAGDLVVVQVLKCLWQEFRERNWREFEEFEEMKEQHFRMQRQTLANPRVVTIMAESGPKSDSSHFI